VVSHIGCPQEQFVKFLISLLKPLAKDGRFNCKNSVEIADALRKINLDVFTTMVSYDATALFPNIPIGDCIELIHQKLLLDTDLPNRTKLSPADIRDLLSLCLSTSYFAYDDKFHTAEDSGPIGLSLMVTISNFWMTQTLTKAISLARERGNIIPSFLKKIH
jgi:hypothetical protein